MAKRAGFMAGVLALAGLLAVAGAVYVMKGGHAARAATARIATATLGVPVTIGGLTVDEAAGLAVARDIKIANPPGFKNSHAVTIAEIRLTMPGGDAAALRFGEVHVLGARIVLEVQPQATNLSTLRRNVNSAAAVTETGPDGQPLRVRAQRVEIADARLTPAVLLTKAEAPVVTLPDIVLRGVGDNDKGGLLPSEAIAQLFDHTVRVGSQAAGQAGFFRGMTPEAIKAMQQQLGLTAGILETAVGIVRKDVEELTEGIRALLTKPLAPEQAPAE